MSRKRPIERQADPQPRQDRDGHSPRDAEPAVPGTEGTSERGGSTASIADPVFTPTKAERELVRDFARRFQTKAPAPRFRVDHKPSKAPKLTTDHPDRLTAIAAFRTAFGTTDSAF